MQVVYAERAGTDLQGIFNHISETNPSAAVRMLQEIDAACARLSDLPLRGRVGRRRGTRELTIVWPHVIVYRVLSDAVSIERIIHGARRR